MCEIRLMTNVDEETLNLITNWMFHWWGEAEGYSYDTVKSYMKHSINENGYPLSFGMYLGEKLIGMYQFKLEDLFVRPDIHPWLANLYIDEEFRNKGYGRKLIESFNDNSRFIKEFDSLYLYTTHSGMYEKFGWEFVEEIDTHLPVDRIQRLYRLKIR